MSIQIYKNIFENTRINWQLLGELTCSHVLHIQRRTGLGVV